MPSLLIITATTLNLPLDLNNLKTRTQRLFNSLWWASSFFIVVNIFRVHVFFKLYLLYFFDIIHDCLLVLGKLLVWIIIFKFTFGISSLNYKTLKLWCLYICYLPITLFPVIDSLSSTHFSLFYSLFQYLFCLIYHRLNWWLFWFLNWWLSFFRTDWLIKFNLEAFIIIILRGLYSWYI